MQYILSEEEYQALVEKANHSVPLSEYNELTKWAAVLAKARGNFSQAMREKMRVSSSRSYHGCVHLDTLPVDGMTPLFRIDEPKNVGHHPIHCDNCPVQAMCKLPKDYSK